MSSPLIDRLTQELYWPLLETLDSVDAYIESPGDHCLFVPGDPAKNLESNDAAVVLPELVRAFQGRFDCAVAGTGVEEKVRVRFDVWPTPSFMFFRAGAMIGAVPKIRDWDDYLNRISLILDGDAVAAE